MGGAVGRWAEGVDRLPGWSSTAAGAVAATAAALITATGLDDLPRRWTTAPLVTGSGVPDPHAATSSAVGRRRRTGQVDHRAEAQLRQALDRVRVRAVRGRGTYHEFLLASAKDFNSDSDVLNYALTLETWRPGSTARGFVREGHRQGRRALG